MNKEIIYFESQGSKNTGAVIQAVAAALKENSVSHIVVASTSGATGLKFADSLAGMNVQLVVVSEHAGFEGGDKIPVDPKKKAELEKRGIPVLVGIHSLSGVGRSISKTFGGVSHTEIIAATLRRFGTEGIKVAVEVAVMAADAGLVPTDREIIAVGGTSRGSDSAIIIKAAHMNNFFDLEIREIIAKPRQRS